MMPYTKLPPIILGVGLGFMYEAYLGDKKTYLKFMQKKGGRNWTAVVMMWMLAFGIFGMGIWFSYSVNLTPTDWN
jgi:hypothetical protein